MNSIWLLVLVAVFGVAWYLGYAARGRRQVTQTQSIPRDYFLGLNFLLNEEPDKAVDIFIKMLAVDSNTVETHLAVGKLFRRRGEVDRAIRIHQNLIARPDLDKGYREQSLFELGQDYLGAGMLDRAERVFLEVVATKAYSVLALRALLDIYQQEKAWQHAIPIAKKLELATRQSMQAVIAHYNCELAEVALAKGQMDHAKLLLKTALEADARCVRASLKCAELMRQEKDYATAIYYLKHVKDQDPDYLSEAIDALAACYEAMNEEEKLVSYLLGILKTHPRTPVVLILSNRIRRWKGDKVAANFVADYIRRYPSLRGLDLLIELHMSMTEGRAREDLVILQTLTKKLLADKPDYQCSSCGFAGKSLHWQCPGCKLWGQVKPSYGLDDRARGE